MTGLAERILLRLRGQLRGRLSRPGEDGYAEATAIWAKPIGPMPRAVIYCLTTQEVQAAVRAARDFDLALSVRGGGHDWAGWLSGMNGVTVDSNEHTARIGGRRARR